MHPLLILAIGIASILGLILILRVNAFLALTISAIVVSLLAPGAPNEQIARVATEFGKAAGNIGIVIALAAIIGECMMASGAADRIVQAFLKVLGERRASWALMGSGYVLAVPVFFDTVFYLLVPLARSLYRKTNKNYLLYILAISAGGAITHTLVPPTPGPLVMASTLGIDVGVMILVGGLIAIPAAIAGLMMARWLDVKLDIPFRDTPTVPVEGGAESADAAAELAKKDKGLPPLWLSLMPVVLPVLMISANTALTTIANSEHAPRLAVSDVNDWDTLRSNLTDPKSPAATRVAETLKATEFSIPTGEWGDAEKQSVIDALNVVMVSKSHLLYDNVAFDGVVEKRWKIEGNLKQAKEADPESAATAQLQRQLDLDTRLQDDMKKMQPHELERANRTLLEVTFPGVFKLHEWNTPARKAADWSALFGNANFALLLSTILAMYLFYRQKSPTLDQLTATVEASLMSGGTIILITAAGGAFGAMLKVAGIGDTIQKHFESSGGAGQAGLVLLLLAYGVAALMKVAQGSSTTAMIVVSGMLASMIPVNLGFHPVYIATAIGAGSLMGSWMNDSGFWIFAKMGRLTEAESLKSWTPMLAVLSAVSFVSTVILSFVLPLV
ncbi:MAG: hypothetical protein H6824_15320 [Planctomycetaceae bacterium]|nr:hypothetical protein [Planctomycetaceae bacterium]